MTDASLLGAYRAAHYLVDVPTGTILLRVDQPCAALAEWLQAHALQGAALLTAHNPHSRLRDDTANARAQQRLSQALDHPGIVLARGRNVDPSGAWPDEPSLLAGGISETAAQELAGRFGQLAYLWCDVSGVPRLRLTAVSR